jgi:hypothetical protein
MSTGATAAAVARMQAAATRARPSRTPCAPPTRRAPVAHPVDEGVVGPAVAAAHKLVLRLLLLLARDHHLQRLVVKDKPEPGRGLGLGWGGVGWGGVGGWGVGGWKGEGGACGAERRARHRPCCGHRPCCAGAPKAASLPPRAAPCRRRRRSLDARRLDREEHAQQARQRRKGRGPLKRGEARDRQQPEGHVERRRRHHGRAHRLLRRRRLLLLAKVKELCARGAGGARALAGRGHAASG